MLLRNYLIFLGFCLSILSGCSEPQERSPRVLASIHPLAMIAASVVEPSQLGVIVAKGQSPHTFNLKPSDVRNINDADIILWAGAQIEPYLAPLAQTKSDKVWIDISDIAIKSPIRDPHRWLSTEAAIGLQKKLAEHLGKASATFDKEVNQANKQITDKLSAYQNVPFFVFHKAYDYWVEEHKLGKQMAFSQNVQQKAGLRSILAIRSRLEKNQVNCVFSEAQFSKSLINAVIGNLDVKLVEIDPMGYDFDLQKNAYRDYLLDLGQKFKLCLGDSE